MPMNRIHQRLCRSDSWARGVRERMIPWVLNGVDLGDDVLEIGPGYGPTTSALADRVPRLTAVEIDPALAARLERRLGGRVTIVQGDGASLSFPDGAFTGVVCLTMLHHVPSPGLQDRLFAEACRVLRSGGVFAGMDSLPSWRFRLLHVGDTMVVVDPDTTAARLEKAGFTDVRIEKIPRRAFRFSARRSE